MTLSQVPCGADYPPYSLPCDTDYPPYPPPCDTDGDEAF